ncbi:N-acetylmuramoyl-L-alanine amidase [Aquimarina latercula]|uniref:N-acetylmuramoyl-L-alanine amidase n=1 Tax=Aquimarina latercula TaxID=987 RepID=UPI00041AF7A5|nr:N-acetylmuramoyl-L-alanine amidase [Aquimarina latercula]
MKTAIVIGHTTLAQGAYSPFLKIREWAFNKCIAEELQDVADIYHYNPYNPSYTSRVQQLSKKINQGNYSLVLELHFNASKKPHANGCEALYYFENKSAKDWAKYFCELIHQGTGIKNRGAKPLYKKSQRGFAAVYYPEPTTLILEPFFGTNKKDCELFNEDMYILAIRELIKSYNHDR